MNREVKMAKKTSQTKKTKPRKTKKKKPSPPDVAVDRRREWRFDLQV